MTRRMVHRLCRWRAGIVAIALASALPGLRVEALQTTSVTRGPYLQLGTPNGIVVRWRTSAATDSRVLYGTQPGALTEEVTASTPTTEHEVALTELAAGTTYYYAFGTSTEILGGDDADHFFLTAPAPGAAGSVRIWALGDSGTATHKARAVRDAYYAFTGNTHTNLWLMLGDNAYSDGTDAEYQAAVFENMYEEMLRKSVLWPTPGNHDLHAADSATQTGPYYDIFTLPTGGEAGGVSSGTEAYYSFDYGDIHFVSLDSQETSVSDIATWLVADLSTTTRDWIIAFWHHPPYTKGSHDSDVEFHHIKMRAAILPVLEHFGVDLVLGGHSHSYERSILLDGHYGSSSEFSADPGAFTVDGGDGREDGAGAYMKPAVDTAAHEGTVFVVAGSSGKTSIGSFDHPVMLPFGAKRGLKKLGSLVLDIDGGRLDASFLDDTGAVRDYFTMVKEAVDVPLVQATMDDVVYSQDDMADLSLDISAGSSIPTVDLYLAVAPGGGSLLFVNQAYEFVANPEPFIVGVDATADQTVTVLDDVPLAGVNPAAYTWVSALTEPGTRDIVGYVDSYQFRVVP